jgi:uncharacterized protein (DUF58 family)
MSERMDESRIDWGKLEPLKLRARAVAEGVLVGMHRSIRKGAGVEFAGQRPYVPGDDLRFFDRRAMLRHDRMMIREFETETERAIWIVVDATLSMSFRGGGLASKFAYAALLAAATARVALWGGDPVGVVLFGGTHATRDDRPEPRALMPSAAQDAFDRIVWVLESTTSLGDLATSDDAFLRTLLPVAEKSRRGAVIVLISDLVDLPSSAIRNFTALGTKGRVAQAVMTLSPEEWTLPYRDQGRFRSLEGGTVVEADPETVRADYHAELAKVARNWERDLATRNGSLILASTSTDPVAVVRELILSIAGQPPRAVERKLPELVR